MRSEPRSARPARRSHLTGIKDAGTIVAINKLG
jgi:hypothetical protein